MDKSLSSDESAEDAVRDSPSISPTIAADPVALDSIREAGRSATRSLSGGGRRLKLSWSVCCDCGWLVIIPARPVLMATSVRILQYPYVPAHVTKPKECKKMFLIQLPERSALNLSSKPQRRLPGTES